MLKNATLEEKNDKNFILNILQNQKFEEYNENSFQYVSEALKNDKEFCLEVLKIQPNSFRFMSENLRNDKDVVIASLDKKAKFKHLDEEHLKYLGETLKNDKNFIKKLIEEKGSRLIYAKDTFRNNREFVSIAIKTFPRIIIGCNSEFLKENKDLVLKSLSKDGEILNSLPLVGFRDNPEMILTAAKNNAKALDKAFLNPEMKDLNKILEAAVESPSNALNTALKFIPLAMQTSNIVKKAIQSNPCAIAFSREDLVDYKQLADFAINQKIEVLSGCSEKYQKEKILSNPKKYLSYARTNIQKDMLINHKEFLEYASQDVKIAFEQYLKNPFLEKMKKKSIGLER
ncbi:hypothetical protein FSBG_00390 [Fusobacterium gonidiaformans 3-1-5R]|uniref:DUF4116 domain-containing protein n=1 Tax=Fusobacterium gonidiaformans 3-1-5R TaxID=469605 RepID=E5BFL2_9FUSO|nr:DUF4116 domain-containing protein [Fusobacterium gonidiaformans]EFS20893.1 hypothetical protein FSBG_00390 [Fusobacterium gonidiaformans 3-1-5R]